MNMNTAGAATVIVMGVITVIMACVMMAWHGVWLSHDALMLRQQYEQRLRATEGLVMIGLAFVRSSVPELAQKTYESECVYHAWPVGDGRDYQGRLSIKKLDQKLLLQACLLHNKKAVCRVACGLRAGPRGIKTAYTIEQWKFGD